MGRTSCSAEAQPHPSLSGLVQKYTGSALSGFAPGPHIGAPSPVLPLIMTLHDQPVTLTSTHFKNGTTSTFSGVVAGLQLAPVIIDHQASSHTLTIDLTPAGVRCLLDVPAVELVGQAVSADAVLGSSAEGLRQRLELVDDWPTRFKLVNTYLRQRLPDRRQHGGLAVAAWETITMTKGRRTVVSVAEQLGCSPRTLHATLKAEVGIGPKALARMVRFASARGLVHQRLLTDQRVPTLAQIAVSCGYADEAHLIRDWSAFTGTTPMGWRTRDEFAFHQRAH